MLLEGQIKFHTGRFYNVRNEVNTNERASERVLMLPGGGGGPWTVRVVVDG